MRQWENLQNLVNDLVSVYRTTGPRAIWNRVFRVHRQIREVVIAVAEFESHEIWVDYDTQISYDASTRTRKEPYIGISKQKSRVEGVKRA